MTKGERKLEIQSCTSMEHRKQRHDHNSGDVFALVGVTLEQLEQTDRKGDRGDRKTFTGHSFFHELLYDQSLIERAMVSLLRLCATHTMFCPDADLQLYASSVSVHLYCRTSLTSVEVRRVSNKG